MKCKWAFTYLCIYNIHGYNDSASPINFPSPHSCQGQSQGDGGKGEKSCSQLTSNSPKLRNFEKYTESWESLVIKKKFCMLKIYYPPITNLIRVFQINNFWQMKNITTFGISCHIKKISSIFKITNFQNLSPPAFSKILRVEKIVSH